MVPAQRYKSAVCSSAVLQLDQPDSWLLASTKYARPPNICAQLGGMLPAQHHTSVYRSMQHGVLRNSAALTREIVVLQIQLRELLQAGAPPSWQRAGKPAAISCQPLAVLQKHTVLHCSEHQAP